MLKKKTRCFSLETTMEIFIFAFIFEPPNCVNRQQQGNSLVHLDGKRLDHPLALEPGEDFQLVVARNNLEAAL